MREITPDELKKIELDILKNIDEFCRTNHLRYCLAYGTLIGAIRHKGFIPWDDDIDIEMPREDYNKLIEFYNRNNHSNGRYRLIAPYSAEARHSFVKVTDTKTFKIESGVDYRNGYLGVDVDVFPIDGMPDDTEQYSRWYDKLYKVYKKYAYCVAIPNFGSWKWRAYLTVMKLLYKDKNKYLKKADEFHARYKYEDCKYVGSMESIYNDRNDRTLKKNFERMREWPFEGYNFNVPVGYDEILTGLYGDYMKFPPIEQQVTHHSFKAYWKD